MLGLIDAGLVASLLVMVIVSSSNDKTVPFMLLHLTFVVSALLLASVDRVSSKSHDPKQP